MADLAQVLTALVLSMPVPVMPGHEESDAVHAARLTSIAHDAAAVALDPDVRPLFAGPLGREATAAAILAVAYHESGFAADVDAGVCYRGKGHEKRCDAGHARCLMQVLDTEPILDRRECFRRGLAGLRRSWGACRENPKETRLAAYASGSCKGGHKGARELWAGISSWIGRMRAEAAK